MKTTIFLIFITISLSSISAPTHTPKFKCSDEVGDTSYLVMGIKIEGSSFDWTDDVQLATSQQFLGCLDAGEATNYKIISRSGKHGFKTNTTSSDNSQFSLSFSDDYNLLIIDEINEEFEVLTCIPTDRIDLNSKCE